MSSSRSPMSALTMASLTSSPASITALAFRPTGEPVFTAARSMSPVDSWIIPRSACSRCACVPLPAPGGPRRMMFSIAALPFGRWSALAAGLQLRLLDQIAILVRDQVALDLRDSVHRHVDNDQQAGAAQVEGHAGLAEQDLRNEADQDQVSRADDGHARDQVVEVDLGRLAWTDARDEAAMALEVLGRFLAVELHRRVEEAEEGD